MLQLRDSLLIAATALIVATASPLANEVRADDYALSAFGRRKHPLTDFYLARAFKTWCEMDLIRDVQLRALAAWVIHEYQTLA